VKGDQSIRHEGMNGWEQTYTAGGVEGLKVTEGREEVTQLVLAQGAVLDGNRHNGLALVQKCVWTGNDLEGWKQPPRG